MRSGRAKMVAVHMCVKGAPTLIIPGGWGGWGADHTLEILIKKAHNPR